MTIRPLAPPPAVAAAGSVHRWPFAFAPRLFALLAAGLLLIGPAWIDRRAAFGLVAWNLLVAVLWAFDARRLPGPGLLAVRRTWRGPLAIGIGSRVELALENGGAVPVRAWLVDAIPGALRRDAPDLELRVGAGATARAEYDVEPRERGDVVMGPIALRYRTAWNLAERWASAPGEQTVRVYPDLHEARRQTMYLVRSRQVSVEKRRTRASGLGRDFESLRDYREGDEPRDICWTATARRAKVVTRVYQPERSQAVWILVDGGRLLRAWIDRAMRLDYTVNAALALAQVALAAGDRVALLTYGRRVHRRIAPGRGPQHLRVILDALATVPAEPAEANHAAAAAAVLAGQKQRALIVWLTDVADTAGTPDVIEHASRLSPRHVVLFAAIRQPELTTLAAATPASPSEMYRVMAAQETVERREVLLRVLRQRGALALELAPGDLTASVVDQYLTVKERSLV